MYIWYGKILKMLTPCMRDLYVLLSYLIFPDIKLSGVYFQGHLVPYNETAGLLPIDHVLTVKRVTKNSEGQYSCSATNTEGETYSAPFTLLVQCKYYLYMSPLYAIIETC